MAEQKKKGGKIRLLVYGLVIGGFTIASVSLFTLAQFEKAKYKAAGDVVDGAQMLIEDKLAKDPKARENPDSKYYAVMQYYDYVHDEFVKIKNRNHAFYVASAIPAYLASMSALVSVGVVLMHADKVKEKEEKEV